MPPSQHPWVSSVTGPMDDAALVHPDSSNSLVMTVDVLTAMVDDPHLFGAIAAANALSDVYAMGGKPQVALSIVGFPSDKLPLEMLTALMLGMREVCDEAGCAIVGGHTLVDNEPKAGLAVTGSIDRQAVMSHKHGAAGDMLVLTKPLGIGIIVQAIKQDAASPAAAKGAIDAMRMLNAAASSAAQGAAVRCATDITGFGLLGHLKHIVEASHLDARIFLPKVPVLAEARSLAQAGYVPGGSKRNLDFVGKMVHFHKDIDQTDRLVLADAQTSGGLLLAVAPERCDNLLTDLQRRGVAAQIVGELGALQGTTPSIRVEP